MHQTGVLHRQELRDVLIKLNGNEPVEGNRIDSFITLFNPETPGQLTESEFVQGWIDNAHELTNVVAVTDLVDVFHTKVDPRLLGRLRVAFNQLDADGDGILSAKDISSFADGGGETTTEEANEALSVMSDGSESGNVTFETFCSTVSSNNPKMMHNQTIVRLMRNSKVFDAVDFARCGPIAQTGHFDVALSANKAKELLLASSNPVFTPSAATNGCVPPSEALDFVFGGQHGMSLYQGTVLIIEIMDDVCRLKLSFSDDSGDIHKSGTNFFHTVRKMFEKSVVQLAEDTCPRGASEWM